MQKPNPQVITGLVEYTSVNGPVNQVYRTTGPYYSESGVFMSTNTPLFKNVRRKNLPHNPFTHTRIVDAYTGDGYWEQYSVRHTWNRGYNYGSIPASIAGTTQPIYSGTSEADSIAKNKLLSRFKSGSVNVGQMFVERGQTVSLLAKSVNRLASAAVAIKRGKLVHAHNLLWNYGKHSTVGEKKDFGSLRDSAGEIRTFKSLKDVAPNKDNLANYWLEFSYGWRPLVSDIYGTCELLADTYFRAYPTTATAKHEVVQKKLDYRLRRVSSTLWEEYANTVITERVRYSVEYVEDSRALMALSNTGLTNPLLLAWEVIPYSFVWDWIQPIGPYLQNLYRTQGFTFVKGSKTVLRTSLTQTYWKKGPWGQGGIYTLNLPVRTHTEYSKIRTVLTSFPSPSFPSFQPLSHLAQIASGLSLLNQLFSKR